MSFGITGAVLAGGSALTEALKAVNDVGGDFNKEIEFDRRLRRAP